jgi:subtilisin family serine protease
LANNIWTNPGEIAGDGIDNDGNGYVDDIHGYDFVNNDADPMDDNSHGTHVAGTIAAEGNNGTGVAGVNWSAQIMPLKFLDAGGWGDTFGAIQAVEYATMMGAKLTSNSWGGGGYSQALYDAIAAAGDAGQLFVAAAGNSSSDNDTYPEYPASYDLDNIIAVAATDNNDQLAWFSNYGAASVDLGAPGVDIYSTFPGNSYGTLSGTAMATPHVSGVAALLWAQNPDMTPEQVKNRILASADPIPALEGHTVSGGRLNAFRALASSR